MATRPNVLVFMCDQLNVRALSCYGGAVPTPNIDRIARDGLLFRNAVCPTPFCSPSRASFITGLYPHSHGIVHNCMRRDYPSVRSPETEEGIQFGDVTTDSLLCEAGYATHHYGKWHLMDDDLPYYPDMYREHDVYEREMAECFAQARSGPRDGYMDWYGWALPVDVDAHVRDVTERRLPTWPNPMYGEFIGKMGRLKFEVQETFDYRTASHAVEAIRAAGERPFSVTCSFNGPHDPNVVPSPYYDRIDPLSIELPENYEHREPRFEDSWSRQVARDLEPKGVREFLRIYHASVALIDDQVGRVMQALEECGQAENTVVVFTADHADMAGEHGMIWKSNPSFYDGVARVPLLVRFPAQLNPGICDIPANLTDMMPTLLGLLQHSIPEGLQGHDLSPFLLGTRDAGEAPAVTFSERVGPNAGRTRDVAADAKASFMARSRELKYVRYPDGEEFLYDLVTDPGETQNVVAEPTYAAQRDAMAASLENWLHETAYPGIEEVSA